MKIYELKIEYKLVSEDSNINANDSNKIYNYIKPFFEEYPIQEQMRIILLDNKLNILGQTMVSLGTKNSTLADPSEIFRAAIVANAAGLIISHNHPSGDPTPSANDIKFTKNIRDAAKILNIELFDHLIIGDESRQDKLYSFQENGFI